MNNNFYQFNISTIQRTLLSLITIQRRLGDGESCEGELLGGSVAENQLRGDVQIDAVVVPVRVDERSRRHVEEVLRGEVKGVHRGGSKSERQVLENHFGHFAALVPIIHAVQMHLLTIYRHTTAAVPSVMAEMGNHPIERCPVLSRNGRHIISMTFQLAVRPFARSEENNCQTGIKK